MQAQRVSAQYVICQLITLGIFNSVARGKRIFSYYRYHAAQYYALSAIVQGIVKKTEPLPHTGGRINVSWVADAASLGLVAFGTSYLNVASRTKLLMAAGMFSHQFATSEILRVYTIPHPQYRYYGGPNINEQHATVAGELRAKGVPRSETNTWSKCADFAHGKLESGDLAEISCMYKLKNRGAADVGAILNERKGRYAYFHGTRTVDFALSILRDGQIDVKHDGAFPGAFVSTEPEPGYGPYYFAFKRRIEWNSPLRSGVDYGGNQYWAGFSEPIKINQENLGCIVVNGSEEERHQLRERILMDEELRERFAWIPIVLKSEQEDALRFEGLALNTPNRCIPKSWPVNSNVVIYWDWHYRDTNA